MTPAPKNNPSLVSVLVMLLVAAICFAGAAIWSTSEKPDRAEVKQIVDDKFKPIEILDSRLRIVEERTARMDSKLDLLVNKSQKE